MKEKTTHFSTTMSLETKELLERFCKSRGLRMNHVVEEALLDYLEDEMDCELINKRSLEDTVAWKKRA